MHQLHVAISNIDLSPFYAPSPEIISCSILAMRIHAHAFIRTFLDIIIEYFGEVTTPALKDNFDIVHQLLEETLDAGGHPITTSPNALRDIVLPPSLITKILSVTGISGLSGPTTNNLSAFSSPIPWRKAGVRYNNNEVYFDIVKTLDAVVNK